MATLTTKGRNRMKASSFALPSKRAYPIPDKAHARAALARAKANASPAQQATIRKAVKKRFPSMQVAGMKKKGK